MKRAALILAILLIGAFHAQAQCGGGQCGSSEDVIEPFYFGEFCTQLGFTVTNSLKENCTGEVKFSVDGLQIVCENSLQVELKKGDSAWVVCTSQQLKKVCEGVHSALISFCNQGVSFTYGKLSAKILMPVQNSSAEGEEMLFSGIGDEGIHKNSTYEYEWSSSIDGFLSSEKDFVTKSLSPGKHKITLNLRKTRGDSQVAQAEIFIQIIPEEKQFEPVGYESDKLFAIIFLPIARKYVEGEKINFMGFAGSGKEPYSYEWRSSVDGLISDEREFSTRNLSSGEHGIILAVTDAAGQTVLRNISILVEKSSLMVSILSPENSVRYKVNEQIPLDYRIAGGKGPYAIMWYVDGAQAENITTLEKGEHEISISVSDSIGNSLTGSVKILVSDICDFDGICGQDENFLNCQSDCTSGSSDMYCDRMKDGICDPDCERSLDEDCFCNYDNVCDLKFENFPNCQSDCPSGSKDMYCDKIKDGICDSDCLQEEDSDCRQDYVNYLLLLILALAVIFAALKLKSIISR